MPNFNTCMVSAGAVTVFVIGHEGILLVKSSKEDPRWKAPGGHVEEGETHKQAAVHEVREETGVELAWWELLVLKEEIRGEGSTLHNHTFFIADIGKDTFVSRGLVSIGETGEETKIIPLDSPLSSIELFEQFWFLFGLREESKK